MAVFLSEQNVADLLDMPTTLEVLDCAFNAQATGETLNRPRVRIPLSNGSYNLMSAKWHAMGVVGHKSYTATRNGASFHIVLYDSEGRGLLAIIEAGFLGKMRTGAATGIATRYMANGKAGIVGLIGAGNQAESQIEAVALTGNVTQARVYSRTAERREGFADRMSRKTGIDIVPVESAEAAVDGASIVVVITNSMEPVLRREMLEPGMHVNTAGNNTWLGRELEPDAVARFDSVVVDDIGQAKIESGTLMRAAEVDQFNWDAAVRLCDVVGGKVPGRQSDSDITLFESLGVALEDIAVAERVYRLAESQGLGLELP
jgi:ornithine cyclodeaminase/alanine dehydrogenase-like protein (mu-crystallin family)